MLYGTFIAAFAFSDINTFISRKLTCTEASKTKSQTLLCIQCIVCLYLQIDYTIS